MTVNATTIAASNASPVHPATTTSRQTRGRPREHRHTSRRRADPAEAALVSVDSATVKVEDGEGEGSVAPVRGAVDGGGAVEMARTVGPLR